MLRRQVSVLLGFLVLAGGLGYGVVQLFNLRMAQGDAFPEYSTLRADPLGTKVLLDSLNDVPGLSAWRNYRPLIQLKPTARSRSSMSGSATRRAGRRRSCRISRS